MYNILNSFFIRSPRSPFNSLKEESFETTIQKSQVQEAIYVASPVLYAELQKYLAGTIADANEKQRIESSLYRYINRMSSRCTPFGLFAGCSMGSIVGDNTTIVLKDYNRCTRLDMYFLCTLSQGLSKLPEIQEKVRYYPNTALYPVGKKYRYIEYQYRNSGRIHRISSVERSGYLDAILKMARKGVRINELLTCLVENEIEQEEALAFIEELIDSQIIVNELSPSVTGDDYFASLIHILEGLNINEEIIAYGNQKIRLDIEEGKMGLCLYFFKLARLLREPQYQKTAEKLLDDIYTGLGDESTAISVYELVQIGMGIDCLVRKNYVKGNINLILSDIDSLIFQKLVFEKNCYLPNDRNYSHSVFYLSANRAAEPRE